MNKKQSGFAVIPLIIVAAAILIGGGVYVATKNKSYNNDNRNEKADENAKNESAPNNKNSSGSLKSLLSIGKNVVCTVENTNPAVSSKGTVYISGTDMNGQFVSTTPQGTVTSNMIRKGDDMYVWSGTQGVKMSFSESDKYAEQAKSQPNSQTNANVDLNQNVKYECNDWVRDDAKFVPPANISFLDMKALLDIKSSIKIPTY